MFGGVMEATPVMTMAALVPAACTACIQPVSVLLPKAVATVKKDIVELLATVEIAVAPLMAQHLAHLDVEDRD